MEKEFNFVEWVQDKREFQKWNDDRFNDSYEPDTSFVEAGRKAVKVYYRETQKALNKLPEIESRRLKKLLGYYKYIQSESSIARQEKVSRIAVHYSIHIALKKLGWSEQKVDQVKALFAYVDYTRHSSVRDLTKNLLIEDYAKENYEAR